MCELCFELTTNYLNLYLLGISAFGLFRFILSYGTHLNQLAISTSRTWNGLLLVQVLRVAQLINLHTGICRAPNLADRKHYGQQIISDRTAELSHRNIAPQEGRHDMSFANLLAQTIQGNV